MFFNLSNNPISNWNKDKIAAAEDWGNTRETKHSLVCMSSQMSPVNPYLSTDKVESLASMLVDRINTRCGGMLGKWVICHVMGEGILAHALIQLLQMDSCRCIASTYEDGEFIQFLEYAQY